MDANHPERYARVEPAATLLNGERSKSNGTRGFARTGARFVLGFVMVLLPRVGKQFKTGARFVLGFVLPLSRLGGGHPFG